MALEAEFQTDRGVIVVDLEPAVAPLAVTNFTGLANGGRLWLDGRNGALRKEPFYQDMEAHRVVNTAGEKFFEIGSRTGAADEHPGYGFPDEPGVAAGHVPYVLAMANDGPNTNGCRVYLTGSLAMPHRNGRYTVLGRVREGPSRVVVDAIIAAGPGGTVVESVTVGVTESWLPMLLENEAKLPSMSAVSGRLEVVPGISSALVFQQPENSVFRAYASTDLTGWQPHAGRFAPAGEALVLQPFVLDGAETSARFYYFSLARYPESPAPAGVAHLANRILEVESTGLGVLVYTFDATGRAGTYENIVFPGEPPFFSGSFVVSDVAEPRFEPYSLRILIQTQGLGGAVFQEIRAGWDEGIPGGAEGRHVTLLMGAGMNPLFEDRGECRVTEPE